jgi:hypothetical protein
MPDTGCAPLSGSTWSHLRDRTLPPKHTLTYQSINPKSISATMAALPRIHPRGYQESTSLLVHNHCRPGRANLNKLNPSSIRPPLHSQAVTRSLLHQATSAGGMTSSSSSSSSSVGERASEAHSAEAQGLPNRLLEGGTGASSISPSATLPLGGVDVASSSPAACDGPEGSEHQTRAGLPGQPQELSEAAGAGSVTSSWESTDQELGEVEESDKEQTEVLMKLLEDFVGGGNGRSRKQGAEGPPPGAAEAPLEADNFVIVNFYHLTDVENPRKVRCCQPSAPAVLWVQEIVAGNSVGASRMVGLLVVQGGGRGSIAWTRQKSPALAPGNSARARHRVGVLVVQGAEGVQLYGQSNSSRH